ncbi:hypothetical protein NHJ13734_002675 [Beauveria thailandica]
MINMDILTDEEIREEYAYIPHRMEAGMIQIRDEDAPKLPRTRTWASASYLEASPGTGHLITGLPRPASPCP